MVISKDTLWKGIIESLAEEFIRFFFTTYIDEIDFERGFEFLDTELQKLLPENIAGKRHADKLIKVWLKDGRDVWFLIHVEIQGYQDPQISIRMFECIYRIREKYHRPVTGLVIYTDWERSYHFSAYQEEFMGTSLIYRFNTYVLRDHAPAELATNSNPFAAIMEAAWQHLDQPKDERQLLNLKLDLVQRLKQRSIPREKISLIIDFIKYYTPFTNSEIQANFEQDLINITKADIPMGLREAILEDVKKQGIEQGAAEKELAFVHTLWSLQEFSFEKMAILVDTTQERITAIVLEFLQTEGKTEVEALQIIADYQKKFTAP